MNLVRAGIKNVICMNGTKLPKEIKELGEKKEITLFVDGDRGGKLIAQNVHENAKIAYIASAPDGKEVEELTSKEILMALRKKGPAPDFFSFNKKETNKSSKRIDKEKDSISEESKEFKLDSKSKEKLKQIFEKNSGKKKAVFLDENLDEIKKVSIKEIGNTLIRIKKQPTVIIIDGSATKYVINISEEKGVLILVAKTFTTTDTKIKLMSF